MFEIAGLPAHILLVHGVVVLAPLAGLGAILYAAWARARQYLAWPLGVLSLGLVPLSLLTAQAGEQLEKIRPASALVHEHAEQGDVLKYVAVIFFLVVAAMLVITYEPVGRRIRFLGGLREHRAIHLMVLVAGVVVGLLFLYQSIVTGHSGAVSVWAR
ncbi:hypothetical protein [Arthrobacter sp. 92]|jgi:hypothetical protein|uniref:hypothetical protein n=1 Tax=Arthrobacter sp. 92 TaxID=3418175 RepID=UPI003CFC2B8A